MGGSAASDGPDTGVPAPVACLRAAPWQPLPALSELAAAPTADGRGRCLCSPRPSLHKATGAPGNCHGRTC